jgi:hypothetical protein
VVFEGFQKLSEGAKVNPNTIDSEKSN